MHAAAEFSVKKKMFCLIMDRFFFRAIASFSHLFVLERLKNLRHFRCAHDANRLILRLQVFRRCRLNGMLVHMSRDP